VCAAVCSPCCESALLDVYVVCEADLALQTYPDICAVYLVAEPTDRRVCCNNIVAPARHIHPPYVWLLCDAKMMRLPQNGSASTVLMRGAS
jgi:hypothetical protein